jgi:hypothetical protein
MHCRLRGVRILGRAGCDARHALRDAMSTGSTDRMDADPPRPLWLSVPAAPLRSLVCVCVGDGERSRLLQIVADHGLACAPARDAARSRDSGTGLACALAAADPAFGELGSVAGAGACQPWPEYGAAPPVVLDLGRCRPDRRSSCAQIFDVAPGTADTRVASAMTRHQLDRALSAGRQTVERAKLEGVELIAMQGAGAGSAVTNRVWAVLLGAESPEQRVACGSCVDHGQGPRASDPRACAVILARHADRLRDPYAALRRIGGLEHAALVGATISAAQLGIPVHGLGVSALVAIRVAARINPSIQGWVRVAFGRLPHDNAMLAFARRLPRLPEERDSGVVGIR